MEGIVALWNPLIRSSVATFNSKEKTVAELAVMIDSKRQLNHPFFVAVANSIVGFVTYQQFRLGVGYRKTMEHTIMVDGRFKGRGIGRKLMKRIEQAAAAKGVHSLIAGISGENIAGINFHKRVGYTEICVMPEVGYKFNRYFDLVVMQKFLNRETRS